MRPSRCGTRSMPPKPPTWTNDPVRDAEAWWTFCEEEREYNSEDHENIWENDRMED